MLNWEIWFHGCGLVDVRMIQGYANSSSYYLHLFIIYLICNPCLIDYLIALIILEFFYDYHHHLSSSLWYPFFYSDYYIHHHVTLMNQMIWNQWFVFGFWIHVSGFLKDPHTFKSILSSVIWVSPYILGFPRISLVSILSIEIIYKIY